MDKIVNMRNYRDKIDNFRGEYSWLSNLYLRKMEYGGLTFNCAEAAYQSEKCPERREEFVGLNGSEARKLGSGVGIRPDWEDVKQQVMFDVCKAKFKQNPDLGKKLLDTGNALIEEGNIWGDIYWGVCDGNGANVLGRILMTLRDAQHLINWKERQ